MIATFTVTITDAERRQLADALGLLVQKLANVAPQIEGNPPSPGPAVASRLIPESRDRWARDRKGNEVPNPAGSYSHSVHIFKAERSDLQDGRARMKVAFDSPNAKISANASCWDEKLFPFLALASKEPSALLHLQKNGKYLNIVGVRA